MQVFVFKMVFYVFLQTFFTQHLIIKTVTGWIWTCSSHMSTTAGACAQTARPWLQQCYICVLTLFSTLWWLTDCCMIYCPKTPKACITSSLCATLTICCWRDFHLCCMSQTASHTINTLTRSSVALSEERGWRIWTSGPYYSTFQWLNLNSCLSWDQVQTESDFLCVWVLRSVCGVGVVHTLSEHREPHAVQWRFCFNAVKSRHKRAL